MKKTFLFKAFFYLLLAANFQAWSYDLTVVGTVKQADGIGRQTIGLIDLLKDDLKINFISSWHPINVQDVNLEVQKILFHPDKTPGSVCILEDPLWFSKKPFYKSVPASKIKIAYSMLEGSEIPKKWTQILNQHFDAVVVPDPFLIEVYQNCGVKIPIFELPLGIDIDDFLQRPAKVRPHMPFIFGNSLSSNARKNHLLLIRAFAEEFGNSPQIMLKLNSRDTYGTFAEGQKLIQSLGVSNIVWSYEVLEQKKYIDFVDSLDCYINISKGEGFSICPREALALGMPCILSNNTAQKTICASGLVKTIHCPIMEAALYGQVFNHQQVGLFANCTLDDVKAALRDVYVHYDYYWQNAQKGPEWVQKYRGKNLKMRYLNLIKPRIVILGEENKITDEYLMTNSKALYKKYRKNLKIKTDL